jgi:putative heme-binding domain-containing protein
MRRDHKATRSERQFQLPDWKVSIRSHYSIRIIVSPCSTWRADHRMAPSNSSGLDDHRCQKEHFQLMKPMASSLIAWTLSGSAFIGIVLSGMLQGRAVDDQSSIPEPAAVWASSPLDITIAFPRNVTTRLAHSLVGRTIPYFEAKALSATGSAPDLPIGSIRIAGARLIDGGRTVIVATDPHSSPAAYQLDLAPVGKTTMIRQYSLAGVEAAWYPAHENGDSEPSWKGWLPDVDVASTRRLTRGSVPHELGLALLDKPGRLVLSTLVKLPAGKVSLHLEASGSLSDAMLGDELSRAQGEAGGGPVRAGNITFSLRSQGEPMYLTFAVETGGNGRPLSIRAEYESDAAGSRKKLERDRLFVPWAPFAAKPPPEPASQETPRLTGGDARRGEAIFFGEQARCSQCHAMGGRGGRSGPDLTEVGRKGIDQVYRSIAAPSAEIAPDYMTYTVATKDGRVMAGLVRAQGAEAIQVTDINAKTTTIARAEIDQIRPSGTSIMPVGLAALLGELKMRDLLAYLTRLESTRGH